MSSKIANINIIPSITSSLMTTFCIIKLVADAKFRAPIVITNIVEEKACRLSGLDRKG